MRLFSTSLVRCARFPRTHARIVVSSRSKLQSDIVIDVARLTFLLVSFSSGLYKNTENEKFLSIKKRLRSRSCCLACNDPLQTNFLSCLSLSLLPVVRYNHRLPIKAGQFLSDDQFIVYIKGSNVYPCQSYIHIN
jgi:hypothetical protein